MESVSVLCLLLLFCSLSGAELEDNEITEQGSPESVNSSVEPQPCPPDIHAVLQDMSAKLAENRLMIQQLQALNQEQAAKLAEVDTQQQEQGLKLKDLENQTSAVETQQQDQFAELNSLMAWANVTGNHVDFLRRQREAGQVAFSAALTSLDGSGGYIGPFERTVTLPFTDIIYNIGSDFTGGEFNPPVRGVYHFQLYIHGYPDRNSLAGAYIMKNTGLVVTALDWQAGSVSPSNGATVLLEPGDGVFVRLMAYSRIVGNRRTTFSGHLLFPL